MARTQWVGTAPPGATVSVFLRGTKTLATIFREADGTPLANPFPADAASGAWAYWADEPVYHAYGLLGGRHTVSIPVGADAEPLELVSTGAPLVLVITPGVVRVYGVKQT